MLDIDNNSLTTNDLLPDDILQLFRDFYMFKGKAMAMDDYELTYMIATQWQTVR